MPHPLPSPRPRLDAGEIRQRLAERHGDYIAGAAFAELARRLERPKEEIRAEIAADWNAGAWRSPRPAPAPPRSGASPGSSAWMAGRRTPETPRCPTPRRSSPPASTPPLRATPPLTFEACIAACNAGPIYRPTIRLDLVVEEDAALLADAYDAAQACCGNSRGVLRTRA